MSKIFFRGGDKDGKCEDYSLELSDSLLQFDGSGGIGSPRGRYQQTNEVISVDGVPASVWEFIDSTR